MDWNRNGANKAPPLTRSCDGLCSVRSEATTTLVLPNKPRRCTCGGKRRLHNQIRKYPTCTLTYRLIFVLIRWKACLASAGRLCCHDFTGNLRERSCSLQQPTLQQLTRINSSQRMSLLCCLTPPPPRTLRFFFGEYSYDAHEGSKQRTNHCHFRPLVFVHTACPCPRQELRRRASATNFEVGAKRRSGEAAFVLALQCWLRTNCEAKEGKKSFIHSSSA